MKKTGKHTNIYFISTIVACLLLVTPAIADNRTLSLQACTKKTFTTTAYYSPKEHQTVYAKGNLLDDIILNGKGTHGASGKEVRPGMIAAPQNYDFGDFIIIPELGIGEIADRGGAIVNAGERNNQHDRLDIRMGAGDEGLIKAISRGKRDIQAYHCPKTMNIPSQAIGLKIEKLPHFKNFFDIAFSMIEMKPGRKDAFVRTLQKYMSKLGYLHPKRNTGYFGPITKQAICQFQLDQKIVSKGSKRCGVYGPKTRSALNTVIKQNKLYPKNLRETTHIKNIIYEAKRITNLMYP